MKSLVSAVIFMCLAISAVLANNTTQTTQGTGHPSDPTHGSPNDVITTPSPEGYKTTRAPQHNAIFTGGLQEDIYRCDLETTRCLWSDAESGNFRWVRTSYSSDDPDRSFYKPTTDTTLGTMDGFYMYAMIEDRIPGSYATMVTKSIHTDSRASVCLQFQVYIEGAGHGRFFVFMQHMGDHKEIWRQTENLGPRWQKQAIILDVQKNSTFRLLFLATAVIGTYGVAAIDDVTVSNQGACAGISACSPWSSWGHCSATCGQGIREKVRRCSSSLSTLTGRCLSRPCGTWYPWGSWSACSSTCSYGERWRYRNCSTDGCVGSYVEKINCGIESCGDWSRWTPWSPCSKSCGVGAKRRIRQCLEPPCRGSYEQTTYCLLKTCIHPSGECPGTTILNATSGHVTSPGFLMGRNYSNNLDCKWRIVCAPGKVIKLEFHEFKTEDTFDVLSVRDGSDESGPRLGMFSGDRAGASVTTTSLNAFLRFQTDSSTTNIGFNIFYEVIHGDGDSDRSILDAACRGTGVILEGTPQRIYSQGYNESKRYLNNLDCMWQITVTPGMKVQLTVVKLQMEPLYDVLVVFDGPSTESAAVAVLSGTGYDGIKVTSTRNSMLLNFQTDESKTDTGFYVTLDEVSLPENPSPQCGVRPSTAGSLQNIIGGAVARPGSWPWQVSLVFRDKVQHLCGGVILNKRWVLTAAHCVFTNGSSTYALYMGGHTRLSGLRYYITRIVSHPDFDYTNKLNDLALLQTSRDIVFSSRVRPICLPTRAPTGRDICYATGWGLTNYPRGNPGTNLRQVQMRVVNNSRCSSYSRGPGLLCVGENPQEQGAHSGDSGGPLACTIQGTFSVAGITSYGHALRETPDVFTDVYHFLSWVRSVMK